jgi:hypothetical protein
MSKMYAEIKRIVDEDISNRVTQFDVLFEAITNAIHANATIIQCALNSSENPIKENGVEIITKKVEAITIIDNGDGLTDPNYDSFCKYRSDYKKALGCKGVGRFVFLKVYDFAIFKSFLVAEKKQRVFRFDFDFDTDNLKKQDIDDVDKPESNSTEIHLSSVSSNYLNYDRNIDRRIELDLDVIKEKVLLNLIPTLFFYKKKGVSIEIKFIDKTTSDQLSITSNDIPDFVEKVFEIKDRVGVSFKFALNFRLENSPGTLNAFYCANNRTVCEFAEKDFKLSLPYGYSGFILMESIYFDRRVNNERNDFTIYPIRVDVFSTLSWEMINDELKKVISQIVKEIIPKTAELNKEKINELYQERPYLVNYIEESDIDIAGFLDKGQLIEKAKRRFDTAKERVLAHSGKETFDFLDLQEAIELAQNELVSYVNDRVQVIERLKKLVEKKERIESVIHNLFMQKQTDDDYFNIGKNNLWLLDDRFTTYSYAASDKGETKILDDKPDLSLFFSHNPSNHERLKSVLVEIKPFDYKSKPDRKKFAGIQQLVDYVEAFKDKEQIDEIFAFLITDIDKNLADRLEKDDYKPLFSLESPIYFRFYQKLGISIFVISATTLIKDAEARNKVFLDIIRKQSRIKDILS